MMPIKCDVRCDNIVKDNLIYLTSKNPILINEKITILKIMSLVLQVKIFHIMFSIKRKQIWVVIFVTKMF
jgi:hypothetical protein